MSSLSYMYNILKIRFHKFGDVPLCNGKASHGFFIGDFCFPLCTRCTSMMFFSFLFYILFIKKKIKLPSVITTIIMCIPLVVDGTLQYFFGIESTNFRRLVTGFLWGYGMAGFLANLYYCFPEKR